MGEMCWFKITLLFCIAKLTVNTVVSEFFKDDSSIWSLTPVQIAFTLLFTNNFWLFYAVHSSAVATCPHHYGIQLFSILLCLSVYVDKKEYRSMGPQMSFFLFDLTCKI